jgi:hypothetical protein
VNNDNSTATAAVAIAAPSFDASNGKAEAQETAPPFIQIAVATFSLLDPADNRYPIFEKVLVGLDREGRVWEFNDNLRNQGWCPLPHRALPSFGVKGVARAPKAGAA